MKVYQGESGMYQFKHLPPFAQFILDHHLDDFIREIILASVRMNIPVLEHIKHLSEEELFQQWKWSSSEVLEYLAQNKAEEFIIVLMQRWLANQLPVIDKCQIQAEDITTISHVRSETMKAFLPRFTADMQEALAIAREIDRFVLGSNTTATNTYIDILKGQLAEETHFNNNVMNASPAVTYIFEIASGRSLYVSNKVTDLLGYTPADVLSMDGNLVSSLGHPDDQLIMQEGLKQMINENTDRTFLSDFRLKAKDGEYRWLRSYLVVFNRDEKGHPLSLLGQVYEVTKEKALIGAIENREQQLLEAQSIARLGSFDWTIATDRTEYTPELRQIFETERPQGYERMLTRVHRDDRNHVNAALQTSFETGNYECEFRYCINNKEKWLWARGRVLFDAEKPVRMIGTVQDVTQRKLMEENLVEKTIALEKTNANLQEFASVASHDMKEPLRKIIIFSDLLLTNEAANVSAQGRGYLQKIADAAGRMKSLIEDILAYSALSGKEKKESVNLYRLVQEVIGTLEVSIKEKAATVVVSDLPDAAVFPAQLTQLFQNLLSNALKFARTDVPLHISISHSFKQPSQINGYHVQKAPQYLEIVVQDNGIGFRNEAAEKIFSLFGRLHSKASFEGTGIGLAICRKVAENHGGVIYARSSPGEGAIFTLLLPENDLHEEKKKESLGYETVP